MLLLEPQVHRSQIHNQVVNSLTGIVEPNKSSQTLRLSTSDGIDNHINIHEYERQEVSTGEISSLHGHTLGKGAIVIPADAKSIKIALLDEHCPVE